MTDIKTERDCGGFLKTSFHDDKCSWFVDYDFNDDTTALVICGSDGIGVFFIVLKGNKTAEFKAVADKYEKNNAGIFGALGECIRFASSHEDLIPERCTIGGIFSSKLKIIKTN